MQTRKQKEVLVKDLSDKIKKMKSAVFADYSGLSVAKMTELRGKLREQKAEIKVAKKTLIDLALKESGQKETEPKKMSGQVAIVMGYEDEIAPAKVSFSFSKTDDHFKILGGILENRYIDREAVMSLAKLPSRQELLAKMVGSMASPMTGMLSVLQGNLRNLVYVLGQIKK